MKKLFASCLILAGVLLCGQLLIILDVKAQPRPSGPAGAGPGSAIPQGFRGPSGPAGAGPGSTNSGASRGPAGAGPGSTVPQGGPGTPR